MNMFLKSTGMVCMALAVSSQAFGMDEVEELKRRLDALEQRSAVSAEPSGEKKGSISFGGLVEVEANYQDTEGAESTTDLTLATFELGVEARVNPWLSAYGVLLYEQGESDDRFIVDEAYIRMKSDSSPIFAEVGRFTQSFGRFESGMISDPMTLELGETKHHASVKAGYEQEGLLASLSVFKGDVQKTDENEINSLVASIDWAEEVGDFHYGVGASWTNNIGDTDGLQGEVDSVNRQTDDLVGGWTASAMAGYKSFELRGEYLGALDKFSDGESVGRQPAAWSVEAGYSFDAPFSLAVRYEGSDDFDTNDKRYGATLGWDVADGAGLAFEYQRADNKGAADSDTFTMQLAMEF